jgi:hypothetical protein
VIIPESKRPPPEVQSGVTAGGRAPLDNLYCVNKDAIRSANETWPTLMVEALVSVAPG